MKKSVGFWDSPAGLLVLALVFSAIPLVGGGFLISIALFGLAGRASSRRKPSDAAEELPLSALADVRPGDFVRVRGTITTEKTFTAPMSHEAGVLVEQSVERDAGIRREGVWLHHLGTELEITSDGDTAKVVVDHETPLVTNLVSYQCTWSTERGTLNLDRRHKVVVQELPERVRERTTQTEGDWIYRESLLAPNDPIEVHAQVMGREERAVPEGFRDHRRSVHVILRPSRIVRLDASGAIAGLQPPKPVLTMAAIFLVFGSLSILMWLVLFSTA